MGLLVSVKIGTRSAALLKKLADKLGKPPEGTVFLKRYDKFMQCH